jgi:hypothetical protein
MRFSRFLVTCLVTAEDNAPEVMTTLSLEEYSVLLVTAEFARMLTERPFIGMDFADVKAILCDGGSELNQHPSP